MKKLWILTLPFFLITTAFFVWIASPIKGVITGNKRIDMKGTWFDKWIDKILGE